MGGLRRAVLKAGITTLLGTIAGALADQAQASLGEQAQALVEEARAEAEAAIEEVKTDMAAMGEAALETTKSGLAALWEGLKGIVSGAVSWVVDKVAGYGLNGLFGLGLKGLFTANPLLGAAAAAITAAVKTVVKIGLAGPLKKLFVKLAGWKLGVPLDKVGSVVASCTAKLANVDERLAAADEHLRTLIVAVRVAEAAGDATAVAAAFRNVAKLPKAVQKVVDGIEKGATGGSKADKLQAGLDAAKAEWTRERAAIQGKLGQVTELKTQLDALSAAPALTLRHVATEFAGSMVETAASMLPVGGPMVGAAASAALTSALRPRPERA
jgi:hypothetical protein